MPSPATIIIGILLVAAVVLIVRHVHKQAGSGGCSACPGGSCGGACGACRGEEEGQEDGCCCHCRH